MNLKKLTKAEHRKIMGDESIPAVNQNHIILSFFEFSYSPDKITEKLALEPLSTGIQGEPYSIGKHINVKRVNESNHWNYEYKIISNEFIGDLIERFIEEIIIPRKEIIKNLSETCKVQFGIVQYYYDGCNPGIHIKKDHVNILSDINSTIDIDLYCLNE